MVTVIAATAVAAVVAAVVYLGRERLGAVGAGLAGLRTVALGALLLGLINPGTTRRLSGGSPTVLLDASLSLDAAGAHWSRAVDTALALSGPDGVLRFGRGVAPFDTAPPTSGTSRLGEALRVSTGRGGGVVVVTDGEIEDAASLPPSLVDRLGVVLVPRDSLAAVALLDVAVDERVQRDDSLAARLLVGSWGPLDSTTATIEVFSEDRRIHVRQLTLPPAPSTVRRVVSLAPGVLPLGTHVLRFRLTVPGDAEPRDNERLRLVTVSADPEVVVLVDPADVEGRFLVRELMEVAGAAVRGYARIQADRWIEMRSAQPVEPGVVGAAVRNASLVVLRGAATISVPGERPVWYWPAGSGPGAGFLRGDWYPTDDLPPSPVAGRLAGVDWDSLPPLTGIVPVATGGEAWVGLTGRLGRRGAARPLLVGRDSSGIRRLTTAGTGLWRWALRGGGPREAYRTLLAGGVDWLLQAAALQRASRLSASAVVPRGTPVAFRWVDDDAPDSVTVSVSGPDSTGTVVLRYDAQGVALREFGPGVYRWSAPEAGARGTTIVEEYSDEFHPRPITLGAAPGGDGVSLVVQRARQLWWLFVVAMVALLAEWGWRQRQGLP